MPAQIKPSQVVNDRDSESTFPVLDLGSTPTTSDIPDGQWAVVNDGTNIQVYCNNGGTIESVDMA